MMGQEESVGNKRRHHRAADHGGDQERILRLGDDPVRQAEKRGDAAERQAGGHEKSRVDAFPARGAEELRDGIPSASWATVPTTISDIAVAMPTQIDRRSEEHTSE